MVDVQTGRADAASERRPLVQRADPRSLPAGQASRRRQLRFRLARAGRADRARRGAQDRAARRQDRTPARNARPARPRSSAIRRCQRIYGQSSDGRHVYIAYEYVAGSTLREATRAGKLTDAGTVEAAAQILEGLAHAHGKGIVHRDVKPANVLLEDAPEISIRLLDFGLARFAAAETLTAVGDVPGTLAYISPERLSGEAATPASDIWSVGVMLWEALAGRHPFWAPSLFATSKKIEAGAPPLSQSRPDLPKPLVAAIMTRAPPRSHCSGRAQPSSQRRYALREESRPPRRFPRQSPLPRRRWLASSPPCSRRSSPGWAASGPLSFYPAGWPLGLASGRDPDLLQSARGARLRARRTGLPAGQPALGLALLYARRAVVWFLLHLREPRAGFAFILGPLLAPLSLLGFLPLALQPVRSAWRRALQAGHGGADRRARRRPHRPPLPFAPGGSIRSDWRRNGVPFTPSPLSAMPCSRTRPSRSRRWPLQRGRHSPVCAPPGAVGIAFYGAA